MSLRGVRGATRLSVDDASELLEASAELVQEMMTRNRLTSEHLVSVIFTCTPDLVSAFPAAAARQIGLTDVPLLCATEIAVRGAMGRVVRILMHVDCDVPRSEVKHVFLRGTEALRVDLIP